MQLYQLLDEGPTIPKGSYVVLNHTWVFPNVQKTFITIALASDPKVINTIREASIGSLAPVTWKPDLCKYIVDNMNATEKEEYIRNDPFDQKAFDDKFNCIVDLNHPAYPVNDDNNDQFDADMHDFWHKGIQPLYVIAKH